MKITVNLPYAEYPVGAVKTIVSIPVHAVKHVAGHVQEVTTEAAVDVVLKSEKGQQMLAEKLLAAIQSAGDNTAKE